MSFTARFFYGNITYDPSSQKMPDVKFYMFLLKSRFLGFTAKHQYLQLVSNDCCYIVSSHKVRNLIVIPFTYEQY